MVNSQTPTQHPLGPSFDLVQPHLQAKHDLIPLAGISKIPARAGWTTDPAMTFEEVRRHMANGGNVGVRLRSDQLVIDVDPRNFQPIWGEADPFSELVLRTCSDPTNWPCVLTGGGGMHYYLTKPADLEIVHGLVDFPGVEFATAGRQLVAAGSVHPDSGQYYRLENHPIFGDSFSNLCRAPAPLLQMIIRRPPTSVGGSAKHSVAEVEQMLGGLVVENFKEYQQWFQIMAAAHAASGGRAREEFIRWSTVDPDYCNDAQKIGRSWDALDADRPDGITAATLYQALYRAGRGDIVERFTNFNNDGSELSNWVWVADATRFIRRSDLKKYKPDQWKSMYASQHPDGDILTAVWKGKTAVRRFETLVYIPEKPEIIDSQYNLWRPSGVQAAPGDTSWFENHINWMFPNDTERNYVIDYLALLVQRPAEKIHFALLIRGAQGTGKSAIGLLMSKIIGMRNVVQPSNDEVTGKFTVWQEGAQLGVIEELMTLGRLEVANRLKPVITEPNLRIEEKHGSPYSIPNYLNLLCFTNHRNALPMEAGDRRWLVVFSPALPKDQAYYARLFDNIESVEGAAAVKHLLLNRAIHLDPKGRAPDTVAKDEMRSYSIGDIEHWLKEQYEQKLAPFEFPLLRLDDAIASIPQDLKLKHRNVRGIVVRFLQDGLGAVQHTRNTKSDGRRNYRLWSTEEHAKWDELGPTARVDAYEEFHKSSMGAE
jgi:hypothetical protein